jgi:hypothetical protein
LGESHPKGEPNKPLDKKQKDDLAFKVFSAVLSVAIMAVCSYFGGPYVGLALISILSSGGIIDSDTAQMVQTAASQSINKDGSFDTDKFGELFANKALEQIKEKFDIPVDLEKVLKGLKDGKLPDGFNEKDAIKLVKDIAKKNGVSDKDIKQVEKLYDVGRKIPKAFSLFQDWISEKVTLEQLGKELDKIGFEGAEEITKKIDAISEKIKIYRDKGEIDKATFKEMYKAAKKLSDNKVPAETLKGLVRGFAKTEADRKLADEAMNEVDEE